MTTMRPAASGAGEKIFDHVSQHDRPGQRPVIRFREQLNNYQPLILKLNPTAVVVPVAAPAVH